MRPYKMAENLGGRPTKLDEEMIIRVTDAVRRVLVTRHVAGLCKISHDTIYEWFKRAKRDRSEGLIDTIHIKFSDAYKAALSEKVNEYIECISTCQKNWQANAWLLERCFREDFGADAGVIQDLIASQAKIEEMLVKYTDPSSMDKS